MDNAMMIGLTRQLTLRRAMDVTANNIANVSTTGFKAESQLLEANNATRARSEDGPPRLAYVDEWGMGRNFAQGDLSRTGRPLDLALEGDGFFALETEAGERYTRDGRFSLDAEGAIVASDGSRLMSDGGGPIFLDLEAGPVEIVSTGDITQNGQIVGRVGVVTFEDNGALSKTGENRYAAPDGAQPLDALEAQIRQGFTESSNVKPIQEITTMLEVSRTYASVTRMIQQTDELSRKAIERLGRPA